MIEKARYLEIFVVQERRRRRRKEATDYGGHF